MDDEIEVMPVMRPAVKGDAVIAVVGLSDLVSRILQDTLKNGQ